MSTINPMDPSGIGFTPESSENGMPPELGHCNLYNAWKAELDHNNLIKNILPMCWSLKVQLIPNYSLEMALQVYVLIRS